MGEDVFKFTWCRHIKRQASRNENGKVDFNTYGKLTSLTWHLYSMGKKLFNKLCYFKKIVQWPVTWKVIKLSPMSYIVN